MVFPSIDIFAHTHTRTAWASNCKCEHSRRRRHHPFVFWNYSLTYLSGAHCCRRYLLKFLQLFNQSSAPGLMKFAVVCIARRRRRRRRRSLFGWNELHIPIDLYLPAWHNRMPASRRCWIPPCWSSSLKYDCIDVGSSRLSPGLAKFWDRMKWR